jgi:hypothetical protein
VFPSEATGLQFLMDLDVNATDERIYSEFRGLHQNGFCILQIFLPDYQRDVVSSLEQIQGRRQ